MAWWVKIGYAVTVLAILVTAVLLDMTNSLWFLLALVIEMVIGLMFIAAGVKQEKLNGT